jgi:hypothetical protein
MHSTHTHTHTRIIYIHTHTQHIHQDIYKHTSACTSNLRTFANKSGHWVFCGHTAEIQLCAVTLEQISTCLLQKQSQHMQNTHSHTTQAHPQAVRRGSILISPVFPPIFSLSLSQFGKVSNELLQALCRHCN